MAEPLDRVLVVGAGPTGLTLGLCLRAYGIDFDIVDRKPGPSRESKALAVNPLTVDQLELFGYAGAVGARACRVTRLNTVFEGQRLAPVDLRWLDHDRKSFLTQPQDETERELVRALEATGTRVAWGTDVLGVAPGNADGDGVAVTLRGPGDDVASMRTYARVVGCDGKRSLVREALGATLAGDEYPMHFVLGDFELDWEGDPANAYYFVYEDTFFVFAPVSPGKWRVVVKHDGEAPTSAPDPAAITGPVRRRFGRDIFRAGPSWISQAPLYMKVASRLAAGRLAIAGDAAHLFSPIGGTGMNTGMQDALNLGWKLAFTIRGRARGPALLASYEAERLEAIAATAAATDGITRLIARIDRAPAKAVPFLPSLARRRVLSRLFPEAHSGLALRYAPTAPFTPTLGATARVGTVCRGLPALLRATGGGAHAGGAPFRVIVRPEGSSASSASRALLAALRDRSSPFGGAVACLAVGARGEEGTRPDDSAWPVVALAPDDLRRLGVEVGAARVVRPDGIVSYDGPAADLDALGAHLTSILNESVPDEPGSPGTCQRRGARGAIDE